MHCRRLLVHAGNSVALARVQHGLSLFPGFPVDDPLVRIPPVIGLILCVRIRLLRQIVLRRTLLQHPIPHIDLVAHDGLNAGSGERRASAHPLSARRRNRLGDLLIGHSLVEQFKRHSDNPRILVGRQHAVHFVIAQHAPVPHMVNSLSESFLVAPADVLRDGAALVLSDGGHHGEDHLGGSVQRAESLLLKAHLDALGAQLLDIDLTVYHVARKTGNALYEDQVDLSLHRVRDHPHELRPLRRASGRYAAIGVDPSQHPCRTGSGT